MYFPSLKEFREKAKLGNLIPVYREILADLETPVSAFKKIDENEYAYLLESVEGGEKWGRYCFLGSKPSIIFKSKGNKVEITRDNKTECLCVQGNPLDILRQLMSEYKPVKISGLPRFFGGAVGYLSYDMIHFFEELPDITKDDLSLPDSFFVITDTILIFDNVTKRIKIVSNAHVTDDNVDKAYDSAKEKIDEIISKLRKPILNNTVDKPSNDQPFSFKSNLKKTEFEQMVKKAKEYIMAGDIIQVVLAQRLQTKIKAAPFDIYRALRAINPSPYMFYLKFGDLKIIGSSPEVLVRVEDERVELRPIAGTRPRGKDERDDQNLAEELLSDPKERAEHIMLVDLGRNDLGRIAVTGTVKVDELMIIEKYSHVMHIVSSIKSILKKNKDIYEVIKACFPAGTVSGAPKIRAMEIIEELEPTKRGPYAGAVGYLSFSGNMDTCITIRTIIIKDKTAYIEAGAGIVADSNPETEYQETMNKAKAMLKSIEMAEQGLE